MVYTRRNLDWWCERGILTLVLGMLVFAPLAFGAVDAWAFLVLQGLATGVLVLWAVRLWTSPKAKLLWPTLSWVVLAFMVYAVARYFTADIEYVARLEVFQALMFGALFLAVVTNLRGQEEITLVSYTLIAVGTGIACYAVAQLTHNTNQVWDQVSPYIGRASGTYISPNNLAGFLALLLPLALAYLLVGKVPIVTRILLAYAALAMAAGLAVTFSRGGYIAAAAGIFLLLVILLGHGNHRWKAALLLVVMLAGGGWLSTKYLSKTVGYMRRVVTPDTEEVMIFDASSNSRLTMWWAATQMWQDHPWTGVGPAHFDYRFREYRPEILQQRPDRVHNDYLNLLADWGIIGGLLVLAGMGVFSFWLKQTWPHVRREENDFGSGQSNRFAFFLGAMCGLAALAAHSAMDFNLHIPANALAGVTLLALIASHTRYATERFWIRPRLPLKLGMTLGLGVLILCLAGQSWRRGGETVWLARAGQLPPFSTERSAALQRAFACEPKNFETAYEIGECFRTESLNGGEDFAALGQKALGWYAQAIRLNPHDGYSFMRTGMCLDWLGQPGELAEQAYREAEARDPNGYFLVANLGWHYVQTGNYAAAQECFARSLKLEWINNDIAKNYLVICETKLAEKASGRPRLPDNY